MIKSLFASSHDVCRAGLRSLLGRVDQEVAAAAMRGIRESDENSSTLEHALARPIQLSGRDPSIMQKALRVFYWIGVAFRNGATSLRKVAEILKDFRRKGQCPLDIPLTPSAFSVAASRVRRFFGYEHFRLNEPAELFDYGGEGSRMRDLTPLGWIAWLLTGDFVRPLGDCE